MLEALFYLGLLQLGYALLVGPVIGSVYESSMGERIADRAEEAGAIALVSRAVGVGRVLCGACGALACALSAAGLAAVRRAAENLG